jgi:mono/diheme cytochrome c family protein
VVAIRRHYAKGLIGVIVAALGACFYVYVSNVRMLEHRYPVVPVPMPTASGSDAVQRGKRLADLTGCTDCHRQDLRGGVFIDEGWMYGRYHASNLTLKAQLYSDEDLARIVRLGVRPDGRGMVAMPSFGFVRLTDREMADIIAFCGRCRRAGLINPSILSARSINGTCGGDASSRRRCRTSLASGPRNPSMSGPSTRPPAISRASFAPNATAAT